MTKFRIAPHMRLQEWVAEEKGYFDAEGLDYEFVTVLPDDGLPNESVASADSAPAEVLSGAFENMEEGRSCEVSSACHWAVNMASSASHGRMWGQAYSVAPSGILVAPESPIMRPDDLRGVEIGVGYHSGSHFSALQALEQSPGFQDAKMRFIGLPNERVDLALSREIAAVNVFGIQKDILEQQGFRKVLDTTFMIGFLINGDASIEDCQRYFAALRQAQRDIDIEPEKFKHYYLREIPGKYHKLIDPRGFSTGERLVFEPYTRELYEKTHRWMVDLQIFSAEQSGTKDYAAAVMI